MGDEGYGRVHVGSWQGESPESFSTDHPPPTDGPLIGMVSHPPSVPTDEVFFSCTAVHVVSLY
jgi:hypothetical protein